MNIYVLTTRNEERVQHLNFLLNGIDFEFIDSLGIDELKKLENEFSKESLKYRKKALMIGEFGAFSTHSMAWEKILKSNELGIIIEDSADFVQDASLLLSEEVRQQIVNCGLVSFSVHPDRHSNSKYKDMGPILFNEIASKKAYPIRCYGLTPGVAKTLLKNMDKTGMIQPVDKWMSIYKMSGVSGFLSNVSVATRKKDLKSIANVRRGKASLNPLNLIYRRINKIKYKY